MDWRCDLCGRKRYRTLSPFIIQCRECSLVATYPQPADQELQERYGTNYYAGWNGAGGRARLWSERLKIVQKAVRSGRLLDMGCGSGEFLKTARQAGFDAAGTEFSARARTLIQDGPVYKSPEEATGLWDAITLWHVLEHAPSPRELLKQTYAKLRAGGWLFIAVPNVNSHWFDIVYRCLKGKKNELYTPEAKEPHLFHFSSQTLRRYLESSSFTVRAQGLDVPDYADFRKRWVDGPARLWFHLTGINWASTHLIIARKKDG